MLFVSPRPLPVSIPSAASPAYVTSILEELSTLSNTSDLDALNRTIRLSNIQIASLIEECHKKPVYRQGKPIPEVLRTCSKRTVRHAHLAFQTRNSNRSLTDEETNTKNLLSLQHHIRLLRRETIRSIRNENLELLWPDGETSKPNARSLRGTRKRLGSFVNRTCNAVTKTVDFCAFPLLPLNVGPPIWEPSIFSNGDGLKIKRSTDGEWIISPTQSIASSEVSTDVEDEVEQAYEDTSRSESTRNEMDEDNTDAQSIASSEVSTDVEDEVKQAWEDMHKSESSGDEMDEDNNENASTGESTNCDVVMCEN
ncbi:hypothetical protein ACLMJK_006057 [Lecanora helva]